MLWMSSAFALSCLPLEWQPELAVVPPDLVLPVDGPRAPVGFVDASGEQVPGGIEQRDGIWVWTPDEPLEVGAAYQSSSGTSLVVAADTIDVPEAPVFASVRRRRKSTPLYGTHRGLRLQFDSMPTDGVLVVQLAEDETFADPLTIWHPPAWRVDLGNGLCNDSLPDYDHDARYFVRAQVLDLAGRSEGWVVYQDQPVGCSHAGPWLAGCVVLLPLVAVRRRDTDATV